MEEIMLKVDNVSKMYKLGQIGGTTLRDELQRLSAKLKGKEDLTKRIGAKDYNKGETFMALNGVSFEVKKGERIGIIGHNGAGKSTLLKLISRVTAPTGGTILMNGRVASMLEVGTGFHGELTGRENIYMNGAILGMTKKEIDAKMEDIIEFSECRQFIDTPVKRYSSGMYVKLAFSVAAHLDSEIMIMDEVLAVGDMAFQKKCLDKMNDVSKTQGRTILYVSHNMNTIRELCERVIVLNHGQVVFEGETETAIHKYLDCSVSRTTRIDFSKLPLPEWITTPKVKINIVEFIGKSEAKYFLGEEVKLRVTWDSICSVEKLCLRIEICSIDKIPVASMILSEIGNFKQECKYEIGLVLDVKNLLPAVYQCKLVFFEKNEYGSTTEVGFAQDIFFEIQQNENTDGAIILPIKAWGYLRLSANKYFISEIE